MNLARDLMTAIRMTLVTTVLLGLVYPLLITAFAQVLFPDKANGQLLRRDGVIVGSRLIGQTFTSPGYFRSRPSAAGSGYDAANSSGTNLGPTNRKLVDTVAAAVAVAQQENPHQPVPADLVTSSASGLDPHLSPDAVLFQVPRVARERQAPEAEVRALAEAHVEERQFGFLGEPRVNVLLLNLALDEKWPLPKRSSHD